MAEAEHKHEGLLSKTMGLIKVLHDHCIAQGALHRVTLQHAASYQGKGLAPMHRSQ